MLNDIELKKKLHLSIGKWKINDMLTNDILQRIIKIYHTNIDYILKSKTTERGWPFDKKVVKDGWYRYMLARYLIASNFTNGKTILDSCSGLGWGSYLLASNAKKIYANDLDGESLEFIDEVWKDNKIITVNEDALQLKLSEKVDVAVAMESMEHFSKEDGKRYIASLTRNLKSGGVLIGSSVFPNSKEEADRLCEANKFHLHVYTLDEITNLLGLFFKEVEIVDNMFFICNNLLKT